VHRTIGNPQSHAAAVVNVLEGAHTTFGLFRCTGTVPFVADPGYPSVNVAKRWTSTEFDAFMAQVQSAATVARSALDSSDEEKSRELWQQLFGDKF